MAAVTTPAATGELIHIPVWAWAAVLVGVLGSYLLLQENGWLVSNWATIHELFHDGRHVLGVPCH